MNDYLSALGLALREGVPLGRNGSLRSEKQLRGFLFRGPGGFFVHFGGGGVVSIMTCYWVQNECDRDRGCFPEARELFGALEQSTKYMVERQRLTQKWRERERDRP